MQNKQAKINKRKVLEITKLDWAGMGYSPIVESNAAAHAVQGYYFFNHFSNAPLVNPVVQQMFVSSSVF